MWQPHHQGHPHKPNCSSPQCSIQDQIPPKVLIRDVGAFCIRTKFLSIHNSTSAFYWYGILSTSEQTWSPFPNNIPFNSLAIWPIVDCVPSKRSRVKESCGEVQSFRIGETAAIPGSCSYAAASGNSKIIWISRITPFTPQTHFYLLPAPIFLNFIKLHFTHISPFLSQYSPPRHSLPALRFSHGWSWRRHRGRTSPKS